MLLLISKLYNTIRLHNFRTKDVMGGIPCSLLPGPGAHIMVPK